FLRYVRQNFKGFTDSTLNTGAHSPDQRRIGLRQNVTECSDMNTALIHRFVNSLLLPLSVGCRSTSENPRCSSVCSEPCNYRSSSTWAGKRMVLCKIHG